MKRSWMQRIVGLVLSIVLTTGNMALASSDPTPSASASWSQRAHDVAAQRLAVACHADGADVAGPRASDPTDSGTFAPAEIGLHRSKSLSQNPCGTGFQPVGLQGSGMGSDPSGSTANADWPRAVELNGFRLASDASGKGSARHETAATAPADSAATQPATVDRGPLPTFLATLERDLTEMPGLLWHDSKKVYGDPLNLVFLLGAGGVSAAMRPEVDDDIDDHYERHHTFRDAWPDTFGAIGNPIAHFAMAGLWYVAGQQFQDIKTYEVGKRAFSALTITGVSTMLLKLAASTDSPNGEAWAWPSGHVSSTMALATVLNDAYGPLVGVPMFALTGLVAVERIDDREHSFSDVVFGAALGWVVAHTVMKEHRPEVFGGQLVPYADPVNGNAGIAWLRTLGK